jgi:hypothetical protein
VLKSSWGIVPAFRWFCLGARLQVETWAVSTYHGPLDHWPDSSFADERGVAPAGIEWERMRSDSLVFSRVVGPPKGLLFLAHWKFPVWFFIRGEMRVVRRRCCRIVGRTGDGSEVTYCFEW